LGKSSRLKSIELADLEIASPLIINCFGERTVSVTEVVDDDEPTMKIQKGTEGRRVKTTQKLLLSNYNS
jgi:hypothetical protein